MRRLHEAGDGLHLNDDKQEAQQLRDEIQALKPDIISRYPYWNDYEEPLQDGILLTELTAKAMRVD